MKDYIQKTKSASGGVERLQEETSVTDETSPQSADRNNLTIISTVTKTHHLAVEVGLVSALRV